MSPFKVKTSIKHKKVFVYYMVRRVNNVWEMSSGLHKVQAKTLDECATAIQAMEKASKPKPSKKKASKAAKKAPSKKAKKRKP